MVEGFRIILLAILQFSSLNINGTWNYGIQPESINAKSTNSTPGILVVGACIRGRNAESRSRAETDASSLVISRRQQLYVDIP